MKKYGIDNFKIEEIEQCSAEQSSEREKYWIDFYKSDTEGYNVRGEYYKAIKDEIDSVIEKLNNLKEKL